MNRGFVFTVYALLFFSLLLSYAVSWLSFSAESTFLFAQNDPSTVMARLVDNASTGFARVYPFMVSDQGISESRLLVSARLADYNSSVLTSFGTAFSSFAQGTSGVSFSLDLSELEEEPSIQMGEATFSRSVSGSDVAYTFLDAGASGSLAVFDQNVQITNKDLNHTTAWSWNPAGDLTVHFTYKDNDLTLPLNGKLSSSGSNTYTFHFTDGTFLSVEVGQENGNMMVRTTASDDVTGDFNAQFYSSTLSDATIVFPIGVDASYADVTVSTLLPYPRH